MTLAIVPARMASSRFPGKPLADIHGVPMVAHCYHRTAMSKAVDATYVATCDQEIMDYCEGAGIPCVMTKDSHERATDRIAEAMLKIEADTGERHDIVVLVQGDEPMLRPEMLDLAIEGLKGDPACNVTNLVARMERVEDFEDPNEVKVVVDTQGYALYFSREPVPSRKKGVTDVPMLKQVCLIPFRRDFLLEYNDMPQTPLEIIESVDMMRILETGGKVRMVPCDIETYAVDNQADLDRVIACMKDDDLRASYS